MMLQNLICLLAFVGAILCVLRLLGIIKFMQNVIKIPTEECLNFDAY